MQEMNYIHCVKLFAIVILLFIVILNVIQKLYIVLYYSCYTQLLSIRKVIHIRITRV